VLPGLLEDVLGSMGRPTSIDESSIRGQGVFHNKTKPRSSAKFTRQGIGTRSFSLIRTASSTILIKAFRKGRNERGFDYLETKE